MRKGNKATNQQVDRVFRTVIDQMMKGPRAKSWSATMPPYCYTEACPDPRYRRRLGVNTNAERE